MLETPAPLHPLSCFLSRSPQESLHGLPEPQPLNLEPQTSTNQENQRFLVLEVYRSPVPTRTAGMLQVKLHMSWFGVLQQGPWFDQGFYHVVFLRILRIYITNSQDTTFGCEFDAKSVMKEYTIL